MGLVLAVGRLGYCEGFIMLILQQPFAFNAYNSRWVIAVVPYVPIASLGIVVYGLGVKVYWVVAGF